MLLAISLFFLVSCVKEIEDIPNEELDKELGQLSEDELNYVLSEDEAIAGQAFFSKYKENPRLLKYRKLIEYKRKISSCTDTDNGRNYLLKGTAKEGSKSFTDVCQDSRYLFEYDCGYAKGIGFQDGCGHSGLGGCRYDCKYLGESYVCQEGKCLELTCPEGTYLIGYEEDGIPTCGQCLADTHCVEQFGAGYFCYEGSCAPPAEEELYDEDGRLTDYARSLAPETLTLNLAILPEVNPESYGNNYLVPGTYNIHVGDGFGKGDFLIKFVEFKADEQRIYFEVFKKESDNNYYHFPTDENSIYKHQMLDLYGISFEFDVDEFGENENVLIYNPDCTAFYDHCYDETSYFYGPGPQSCNWRCGFNANDDEIKVQEGIYSAVYPQGYENLANFAVDLLEQCYNNDVKFLGYDQEKPRLGVKVMLSDSGGPMTGRDEYVSTKRTTEQLDDNINILDFLISEKESKRCTNYLNLGHEFTHSLTKEMLGDNYGLNEGIAEFVAFQNGFEKEYVCSADGWRLVFDSPDTLNEYASLSTNPGEAGSPPSKHYYATGYCFWNDFMLEYGYPQFVEVTQQLYQKSRGISDYYVLDVIENVIGEDSSIEMMNRYSLTKEATKVEGLCNNCDMFIS